MDLILLFYAVETSFTVEHVEKLAQVTGGKRKNLQENEGGNWYNLILYLDCESVQL